MNSCCVSTVSRILRLPDGMLEHRVAGSKQSPLRGLVVQVAGSEQFVEESLVLAAVTLHRLALPPEHCLVRHDWPPDFLANMPERLQISSCVLASGFLTACNTPSIEPQSTPRKVNSW
jgi:hypothetical protein